MARAQGYGTWRNSEGPPYVTMDRRSQSDSEDYCALRLQSRYGPGPEQGPAPHDWPPSSVSFQRPSETWNTVSHAQERRQQRLACL